MLYCSKPSPSASRHIYFLFDLPQETASKEGMFHFSTSLVPYLVHLTKYLWISIQKEKYRPKKIKYYSYTELLKCLIVPAALRFMHILFLTTNHSLTNSHCTQRKYILLCPFLISQYDSSW